MSERVPVPPREAIERLIAAICFPSNPDMSGDPRRKLHGGALRRVEDCARAIVERFDLGANLRAEPPKQPAVDNKDGAAEEHYT